MAKISTILGGSVRTCMLVLTFTFLVCEIVVGQICRSLLIAVDSFHTLYVFINMALSATKHRPKTSLTNPHLSSTCLSEPHKSFTTSGSSLQNITQAADPASGSMGCPGTLPEWEPYSRMRLQPFGVLISALLLASQCVSVSLEILTRLVQPEAIQHPFLSIEVGATSLLFNILILTWRSRSRGMNEAVDGIEFPGLIQNDLHSTSESKGIAVQDEALVFCNPEAPSVLNPDQSSQDCSSTCSELQNHHVSKPVPKLSHAQGSNSSNCQSSQEVLQSTQELSEELVNSPCTDRTSEKLPLHDQAAPHTSQCTPVSSRFRRHFITMIQDLLCSALILVNGLIVLLIKPHCQHPHSDCHLLVYLDASLSILVVLVLLATALPKLYRYGLLVLQATPLHLCISEVRDSLTRVPGVLTVHELHVWQLSDTYVVASVHVHCPEKLNAEECSDLMVKITGVLKAVGIHHCTVQPEFLPSYRGDAVNSGGDGRTALVSSGCSLRCGQECAEKLCCSSQVEKSCFLQANSSTASKDSRSICAQEESFSLPAPSSVDQTKDAIIENTYL